VAGHRAPEALKALLRGAIGFPITPFTTDGDVDLDGVRRNVAWVAEHDDLCAVVAPSGTGEIFALDPGEIVAVTHATVDAVDGRIPVIASVGFNARIGAELAQRAEHEGADGVLIMPPYYAAPDPAGLLEYYTRIANATSLGVLPYARDAAALTPELVEQLAKAVPNLVGFKDGRGDVRLFQRIREQVVERLGAERLVWLAGVGDDLVGAYFAAGAQGFTSSLACFWPEASAELYRLASTGDFDGLRAYHQRVVRPFYELRQRGRGFEVSVMKAAMDLLGHPAGPPRPPLGRLSETDRSDLRAILERLGVPTAASRSLTRVGATPR
jgi:5-dehydro-4-deoxyglucarate dehydratase